METLWFLDLEETIIDNWDNQLLINTRKIRSLLEKSNVSEIHIFSFAISNNEDLHVFNQHLKQIIQRVLNVKIIKTFTVEEICSIIYKDFSLFDKQFELLRCLGKQRTFIDVCEVSAPKNSTCVLIDDSVDNIVVNNFTKDVTIVTINVKNLT